MANGEKVLTGDSFFHLAAFGEALPGLNLCGAGRVVCLIDPVGDVYACPFAIHDSFMAGSVRDARRFPGSLAGLGAVRRTARAAERRRLRVLPLLRLLPGRVHGGEVLHRPAAGRPGPGVRARLRRAGAGRGERPDPEALAGPLAQESAAQPEAGRAATRCRSRSACAR